MTERDEVFYGLFKRECIQQRLEWYWREGELVFAKSGILAQNFFKDGVRLLIGTTDAWFEAYSGLMKWIVEQDVRELLPAGEIAQIMIDYGLDEPDAMKLANLINKRIKE